MKSNSGSNELQFDDLLAEYTERVRLGEHPPIIEYLEKHPGFAEQINEFFPLILQLEQGKTDQSSDDSTTRWKFSVIEKLGDYLLIREIGRGGMGVVYEARQSSLDRRVALKVLKDELVDDPKNLARFQREGRMAAMLHHGNIVPVLGTGSERGKHYIVMQMVDGVGLDVIIEHLLEDEQDPEPDTLFESADPPPSQDFVEKVTAQSLLSARSDKTDWQKFAKLAFQISDALVHAHDHQLIHRDIKPSNLIVDRFGKPWIVDFGLAKNFASGDDISRIAGTPRYMAPEQLVGNANALSDIFSFGLSLYELATRRRVFETSSVEYSGSFKDKREKLTPIGQVVPEMPKDLQRIVTKCIALDPIDRYPNASSLAEDLQRFLENRPLANVQVSPLDRTKRWAERNPATAIASGIAALLLAGIAMISFFNYWNEHNQRTKLETTLEISINALDKVYNRLAPDADSGRSLSPENAELLNDLLPSYDRLASLDTQNTELRKTAGEANYRVGEINRRLGRTIKARNAFKRSIQIFQSLENDDTPYSAAAKVYIAKGMIGIGRSGGGVNQVDRQQMLSALNWINSELAKPSKNELHEGIDDSFLWFQKARALFILSNEGTSEIDEPFEDEPSGSQLENPPQSKALLNQAIQILESWGPKPTAEVTALLAQAYAARSQTFNDTDFKQSIQLQENLVQIYPKSTQFQIALVDTWESIDPLKLSINEFPQAADYFRNAARLAKNLNLTDVQVNRIVKHLYHKLALFYGRLYRNTNQFTAGQISLMLGNDARKPLEQAILYGRMAVQIEDQHMNSKHLNEGISPIRQLRWRLRFRATLCQLLWERNQGNDRQEVRAIIKETQSSIGSINLSTNEGRGLARTLKQLTEIAN